MKKLYTFCLSLLAVSAIAQPTMFGTDAEDGQVYQEYTLINHGEVSSVRFMAQNDIPAGVAEWQFFTGNYDPTWRPYTANDTLSGYNAIIDPAIESSSARYNTQAGGGGEPGRLQDVQAGYYYTAIVQNGGVNNLMSIVETDFEPVAIDTIIVSPEIPTFQDDIVITVELDGAMMPSAGEHVFIRASLDYFQTSLFFEITNFSNGVGTYTVPAGTVPVGVEVFHYGLVTNQSSPDAATIDYFTLFFEHLGGAMYTFEVAPVTVGIEDVLNEYGIIQADGMITVKNSENLQSIELVSVDGQRVTNVPVAGGSTSLNTEGLPSGIYILNLIGNDKFQSTKLFVD